MMMNHEGEVGNRSSAWLGINYLFESAPSGQEDQEQ
jgi:hypothetical protein